MDFEQLHRFSVIAKYGNMTKAADLLHVSQSSLSYSLTKLEEELGVDLFEREKNRLVLTKKGKELLPYVAKLGNIMDQINEKIASTKDPEIVIAPTESFGSFLIDELPNEIKKKMNFVIKYESEMPKALFNGEIMAAITEKRTFDDINISTLSSLASFLLGLEQMGVFVNEDNPLASKESLRWSDLDKANLVKNISALATNSWIERVEEMRGVDFHFSYYISRNNQIDDMDAVEITINNGISNNPFLSHHLKPDAKYIPIKDRYSTRYVYVWYLSKNKKYLTDIIEYMKSYYKTSQRRRKELRQ